MRERGAAMGAEFKGKGGGYPLASYQFDSLILLSSSCSAWAYDESDACSGSWSKLGRVSDFPGPQRNDTRLIVPQRRRRSLPFWRASVRNHHGNSVLWRTSMCEALYQQVRYISSVWEMLMTEIMLPRQRTRALQRF